MEQRDNPSNNKREFVIVKNTSDRKWQHLFFEDPRIIGVRRHFSAYFSFDGHMSGIDVTYTDFNRAKADLAKILEINPYGEYDVCPLLN